MFKIIKKIQHWAVENSLTAYVYRDGCCSFLEKMWNCNIQSTSNPHHADLLVVSGIVNKKSIAVLKKIYNQMPSPKYVIAIGNCAINGGIFKNTKQVFILRDILPVSVEILGCPVSENNLLQGIQQLREKIKKGEC